MTVVEVTGKCTEFPAYVLEFGKNVAPFAISSAAISLVLVEVGTLALDPATKIWKFFRSRKMVIAAYLKERKSRKHKEEPKPEPVQYEVVYDHSVERAPEAFDDTHPGLIDPEFPEETEDDAC